MSVNDLFHIQYRTTAYTYKINKIPPNPSEGLFLLLLSVLLIGTLCEMHLFYLGKLNNQGYKWPQICSTCGKHCPVLSTFMTYHRVCNYRCLSFCTFSFGHFCSSSIYGFWLPHWYIQTLLTRTLNRSCFRTMVIIIPWLIHVKLLTS